MPAAEPPAATRWCTPATSVPTNASADPHQPARPRRSPSTGPENTATSAGARPSTSAPSPAGTPKPSAP